MCTVKSVIDNGRDFSSLSIMEEEENELSLKASGGSIALLNFRFLAFRTMRE